MMEYEEWKGRLDILVDDCMRMGAALGTWIKVDEYSLHKEAGRAAIAALSAGKAEMLDSIIEIANTPHDEEQIAKTPNTRA